MVVYHRDFSNIEGRTEVMAYRGPFDQRLIDETIEQYDRDYTIQIHISDDKKRMRISVFQSVVEDQREILIEDQDIGHGC